MSPEGGRAAATGRSYTRSAGGAKPTPARGRPGTLRFAPPPGWACPASRSGRRRAVRQARVGDQRLQARCGVRRDPAVFGAPQDLGRRLDARVERFQMAGEVVVVLRDLAVIGGLAVRTGPRRQQRLQGGIVEDAADGGAQMGRQHRLVDVGGQRLEHADIGAHQQRVRRAPGIEGDAVDDGEACGRHVLDQMRAEHGGGAEIMSDQMRPLEAKMRDQFGQHAGLRAQAHILLCVFIRVAVAGEVVGDHLPAVREARRHLPPDEGRARRAVHQDQRCAAAPDVVPDAALGGGEGL